MRVVMSMEEADWVEELEKQEKGLTGKVNLQKHDHVVILSMMYVEEASKVLRPLQ